MKPFVSLRIGTRSGGSSRNIWVATRQSIAADLIHVVTTRRARSDRGLDRLDLIDVDDWLLSVLADSVSLYCPSPIGVALRR